MADKHTGLEWIQLNPVGQIPTARSGHTVTGMGRISIMFGGIDPSSKKNGKMFPNNQVPPFISGFYCKIGKGQHRMASDAMRR